MEFFVSVSGNDANPGTLDEPFRTVNRGVEALSAGDVLSLRHGIHIGPVRIAGKRGTAEEPIVIRSRPGEHAYIDGTVNEFRARNNDDWIPARSMHDEAVDDEFVSATTFDGDLVNRGAFLDRNPYTRLVTYANLNDLRAANETSDRIVDAGDPRPGPSVTDREGNPLDHRRPWVYMGPGLHFSTDTGRVHVRLSHTHNDVPGVTDYAEQVDPRRVPLAITPRDMTTLHISGSSHVRLERLTISYGGETTITIQQVEDVAFDHVRIRAATIGVRMGGPADNPTRRVIFADCQFLGGVPTWQFQADRTAGYFFRDGEAVVQNDLAEKTSQLLMLGNPNNVAVEIRNCEFLNGHIVVFEGRDLNVHHNVFRNLRTALRPGSEGAVGDGAGDVRIHHNVVTRSLRALNMARGGNDTQWFVYRNLIDLRDRLAVVRPRRVGDTDVWRHGRLQVSDDDPVGPYDFFQNTVLSLDQRARASFLHYGSTTGAGRRRSFNNIFVAVNPGPESDRAVTFVPSPAFPGPTDGNLYHRVGFSTAAPFRHAEYRFQGQDFTGGAFASLAELRASALFEQSRTQYPPGYEARSLLTDPSFLRFNDDGRPRDDDDLRLSSVSPALGAGIRLPDELARFDPPPNAGDPDIGCYPVNADPLDGGVDGCQTAPRKAPASTARPRRLAGGVWRFVFLHEFPDGDPANLRAIPGALTVLPDGPVIDPTPDPDERGLLMAPGNRLLSYRFDESFDDVIGVDLSVDFVYPRPNPPTEAVFPLVNVGPGALTLAVGRRSLEEPLETIPVAVHLTVDGQTIRFDAAVLPPFRDNRTTRLRVRWHTHGQASIWHEGILRAYEPGLAAGRSLRVGSLVIGIPFEVPTFAPRYRIQRVSLKLLRRDAARQRLDGQVPLDLECLPPDPCVEQIRALQEEMLTRIRVFMTEVVSRLTRSWREGAPDGPFSPQATAAHAAALAAGREFGAFLETSQPLAGEAFLTRIDELFRILAEADSSGFAALIEDLARRSESIDPACRRSLEPAYIANAATLRPLESVMQAAWQRAQTVNAGGPNG